MSLNSISELLLTCNRTFSKPVVATAQAAVAAGRIIHETAFTPFRQQSIDSGSEKDDQDVGHHAIVTPTDFAAQETILSMLFKKYPQAYFLTEEKARGISEECSFIRTLKDLEDLNQTSWGFCIDPFDGTSSGSRGSCEYSASIAYISYKLNHIGGAIFAPAYDGGILGVGELGVSVAVADRFGTYTAEPLHPKSPKDSIVMIGPDINFLGDQYGVFWNKVSKTARTTNCTGSCALGLLLATLGRIDCLVQPVQGPWDWAAGYPLLREVGGVMRFYHYRNGKLTWLSKPDLGSYDPVRRKVAFVAGNPSIVEWVCDLLQTYWNRSGEIATLVNALSTAQNAYQPGIIEKLQSLVADNV